MTLEPQQAKVHPIPFRELATFWAVIIVPWSPELCMLQHFYRWLASNPNATVLSFDRMELSYSHASLRLLQSLFPGRLELVRGSSDLTMPERLLGAGADAEPPCDLVSIDGGHDWATATHDVLNVLPLTGPRTLFLFDESSGRIASAPKAKAARPRPQMWMYL